MRLTTVLLALATTSITHVLAQSAIDSILQQPPCVLQCVSENVNLASILTNLDSLCVNKTLVADLTKCTMANCTVKQNLLAKKAFNEICHVPYRDKSKILFVVTIAMGTLVALSFGLRCLTRLPPLRVPLGWDDFFCTLAVAALGSGFYFTIRLSREGLGRDIWTLSFDQITTILWLLYVSGILYHFITGVTKLSILFFCRRIFLDIYSFRIANTIIICLCAALTLTFVFGQAFQCVPVSYLWTGWDKEEEPDKCVSAAGLLWASAITSILLDLSIIASTVPYILRLNLTLKKKIQISIMFCVGFFITIISIVRLYSLVGYPKSTNPTWDKTPTGYWSLIEADVGIICACMPAIQLLFRRLWPTVFGDEKRAGYSDMDHSPASNAALKNEPQQNTSATASTDRTRVTSEFEMKKYGIFETIEDRGSKGDSPKSSPRFSHRSNQSPLIA